MKTAEEIITGELEIWKNCYPKNSKLLKKFAEKIILELTTQGQDEADEERQKTNWGKWK